VKTQEALNLLVVLEERVARIYFQFFRAFREDPIVARCWWDMARDEYGHAGILKMVSDLVGPGAECEGIGPRLWSLVEAVERCEGQVAGVASLGRALELAIRLESSELDALSHRVLQSVEATLPEGTARSFVDTSAHRQRLSEAAGHIADSRLRQRLEALLAGGRGQ
jgi:hypothetical protein